MRLTASKFGEVMRMRASTDGGRLARDIANPAPLNVPAVVWGREMELVLRRQYEVDFGVTVSRSGLVVDPARPFLACSPDGVLPDRVVELKGVYSRRHHQVGPGIADWLETDENGQLQLKAFSKHWFQVQGQMAIVGRELCDLVVFTDASYMVVPVRAVPGYYV